MLSFIVPVLYQFPSPNLVKKINALREIYSVASNKTKAD